MLCPDDPRRKITTAAKNNYEGNDFRAGLIDSRLELYMRSLAIVHNCHCNMTGFSKGNTYDIKLSWYTSNFDSIDCLRYLLLNFVDILDGCLCYSTKLHGGGDKA